MTSIVSYKKRQEIKVSHGLDASDTASRLYILSDTLLIRALRPTLARAELKGMKDALR